MLGIRAVYSDEEAGLREYSSTDHEESESESDANVSKRPKRAKAAKSKHRPDKVILGLLGYDNTKEPIVSINDMFKQLAKNCMKIGLREVLDYLGSRALDIGTMCSGSEAPILGITQIAEGKQANHRLSCYTDLTILLVLRADYGRQLRFKQPFAAEIHPAKAAFIERNGPAEVIFRDIVEILIKEFTPGKPFNMTTSYGGTVAMVNKLNILIAGFACDDFSTMNNSRKTLEEKGESGDTFHAILASLPIIRPDIVILENVKGAPWKHEKCKGKKKNYHQQVGIDKHFQDAGYYARVVIVDSKDFYVPHTRQRGYFLAIRKESIPEEWKGEWDIDAFMEAKLDLYEKFLKSLYHKPTAPAEAWLFAHDDPRLAALRDPAEADTNTRKAVPWESCRNHHEDYRNAENLGSGRPVTNWRTDGSKTLPDYFHPTKSMSQRILDSIDIAHIRNLKRGQDDRHYGFVIPFHLLIQCLSNFFIAESWNYPRTFIG